MTISLRSALAVSLVLASVTALAGCGQRPAPPSPAEPAAQVGGGGSVAPPGGGDIVVDGGGWKQGSSYLSVTPTTDVWIPSSFTGSVTEIRLANGMTSSSLSSIQITFPSGAGLSVTPGSPATWQCRAPGGSFAACATNASTSIPSTLTPTVNGNNATIALPNGSTLAMSSGVSLTFK